MDFVYVVFAMLFVLLNMNIKNRKTEAIMSGLIVWALVALRSAECGGDILGWSNTSEGANYYNVYQWAADSDFTGCLALAASSSQEIGWILLNWGIAHLYRGFAFFIIFISTIQIGIMGYVFYKNSKSITLSFIVFLCLGLFIFFCSGIRQATAIPIVLMAYEIMKSGKRIIPIGLVLLASSIHSSALVGLIALVFVNRPMSKKRGSMLFVGILLLIPFLRVLVPLISSFLFSGRYQDFINEGGAYSMFMLYLFLFGMSINKVIDDKSFNFTKWMVCMTALFQSFGLISTGAMTRIGYYFSVYLCIYVAEYIVRFLPPTIQGMAKNVTAILLLVFFLITTSEGSMGVLPYKFFWETPLYIN